MTGVRKPVENHSRRLRAKISASWFSTVSLSPWETRQTPPSFPHSHSPERVVGISQNNLRACGAPNEDEPDRVRLAVERRSKKLHEVQFCWPIQR
jgi:hypothetical protein